MLLKLLSGIRCWFHPCEFENGWEMSNQGLVPVYHCKYCLVKPLEGSGK